MGTEADVTGFKEVGGSALEIKTRTGTIVYRSDTAAAVLAAAPSAGEPGSPPAAVPVLAPAPPAPVPGSDAAGAPPAPARSRLRNPNLIERQEIEASTALDAYAMVQEARPLWFHSRGVVSLRDPNAGVLQVYLNGMQFGDVNRLREIQLSEVRQLRFYGAAEAQQRYGTGHAGGVIDVSTGAVAPTGTVVREPTPPAPPPPAVHDSTRGRPNSGGAARNSEVLEADEFAGSTALDAMALVQEFRPNWLRALGVTSIHDQSSDEVRVSLNGVSAGDVNQLREIRVSDVRELRHLGAAQAQARYGVGHGGGVIEVLLR